MQFTHLLVIWSTWHLKCNLIPTHWLAVVLLRFLTKIMFNLYISPLLIKKKKKKNLSWLRYRPLSPPSSPAHTLLWTHRVLIFSACENKDPHYFLRISKWSAPAPRPKVLLLSLYLKSQRHEATARSQAPEGTMIILHIQMQCAAISSAKTKDNK